MKLAISINKYHAPARSLANPPRSLPYRLRRRKVTERIIRDPNIFGGRRFQVCGRRRQKSGHINWRMANGRKQLSADLVLRPPLAQRKKNALYQGTTSVVPIAPEEIRAFAPGFNRLRNDRG
jgi:hypothetical protein